MKNFYEHIEAYHRDWLKPEDRVSFEEEMNEDPDLKKAVDAFEDIEPALDYLLEEDIRGALTKIKADVPINKEVAKVKSLRRPLSIAAGVLILLFAGFWLWPSQGQSGDQLFAKYYENIDNTSRSVDSNKNINPSSPSEKKMREAHEALLAGDVRLAEQLVREVDSSENTYLPREVEWFLVMSALKSNNKELARTRAQAMLGSEKDNFNKKLHLLLKDLE